MWAQQLPEAGSDDRVGFGHRHAGAHQAGRGAVGGFEHRVDLGLCRGRVFLQVDAQGQQTAGGAARRRRVGGTGQRQQHPACPEVAPAACRDPLQGGAGAGRGQFGGEAVEKRRQSAQRRVRKHRGDDLRRPGDHLVVHSLPSGAREVAEPGAGGGEQVHRLLPVGRRDGLRTAGATGHLRDAGHQCVVDGTEQCGAGGGEGDEVVFARRSGRRLLRRLKDPGGQWCPRDGVRELGQTGGLGGLRTEQTRDENLVEGVHGRQRFVEPGDGVAEQVRALPHARTELARGHRHLHRPGRREPLHLRQRCGGRGEFQIGQVAQEPAEDGRGGLGVSLRRPGVAHDVGDGLSTRLTVRELDPQVAGDALGAVLQHRLVDEGPDVVAEHAPRTTTGTVVVGAAGEPVGAGRDRRDVDPLDVGAAGHHALEASVGQLHEGHLGEFPRPRGRCHPCRARPLPIRQRTISYASEGTSAPLRPDTTEHSGDH